MTDILSTPLVIPFVGERFADSERLSNLVAPPYDVISVERRRQLAQRDAHNIVHLILPEGNDDKYERAAALLAKWRAGNVLKRDVEASVYVVRQGFGIAGQQLRNRTGVIAAVAVEPFARGRVKPHEKTHAEPKADRLALLKTTKAMFESLLLLARDEEGELARRLTDVVSQEPTARAELDDMSINLWQVTGSYGEAIARAAGAGALYIADGHHRYETAIAYRKSNPLADRTLGMVVSLTDPGLKIRPTHRIIYGEPTGVDSVIGGLHDRFRVHELPGDVDYADHLAELRTRGTACVIVRPGGNSLALLLKAGAKLGDLPFANEPTVASLDVARVDEMVVKPLLAAAGADAYLAYSPDPDRVCRAVVHGGAAFGVLLNATSVEHVLAVADAGAVMPQKATFFAPKVPSGLVALNYGS
ncbi:MAG: DUF1015 domain-containing protein [Gemmatimonadota bacterium]|nr:MAG: DUF1015 domain-containing protein [Gemmatimonadota bacterium]